ncbi:hypothetical protein I7I50_06394 [Histoplasma capsulatum G186AR]|uniref:Uncharacterized protein n=1 Tax=Ajellomyces capsulatus TaxID=5037 RepID=A0A8H7Z0W4_AJECA|nr:hypothetical protein I7I52_10533 [Histoplasma capsulatum]QSS67348.1 hypothetical protein I7I50_06394 [Histoplasma capsulatum G186AR]
MPARVWRVAHRDLFIESERAPALSMRYSIAETIGACPLLPYTLLVQPAGLYRCSQHRRVESPHH